MWQRGLFPQNTGVLQMLKLSFANIKNYNKIFQLSCEYHIESNKYQYYIQCCAM